jgi:hypothetical protein
MTSNSNRDISPQQLRIDFRQTQAAGACGMCCMDEQAMNAMIPSCDRRYVMALRGIVIELEHREMVDEINDLVHREYLPAIREFRRVGCFMLIPIFGVCFFLAKMRGLQESILNAYARAEEAVNDANTRRGFDERGIMYKLNKEMIMVRNHSSERLFLTIEMASNVRRLDDKFT